MVAAAVADGGGMEVGIGKSGGWRKYVVLVVVGGRGLCCCRDSEDCHRRWSAGERDCRCSLEAA